MVNMHALGLTNLNLEFRVSCAVSNLIKKKINFFLKKHVLVIFSFLDIVLT